MPEFLGLRAGLLRTTKIFKFDPRYVSEEKWQTELDLVEQIAAAQESLLHHHHQHDKER